MADGLSRRDMIKGAAVAGAAAWTAPMIIDSLTSPAAALSHLCNVVYGVKYDASGNCSSISGNNCISGSGANGCGLVSLNKMDTVHGVTAWTVSFTGACGFGTKAGFTAEVGVHYGGGEDACCTFPVPGPNVGSASVPVSASNAGLFNGTCSGVNTSSNISNLAITFCCTS